VSLLVQTVQRAILPTVPDSSIPETNADESQVSGQGLARAAWLLATTVCLVAALVTLIDGYHGYAAVGFAVAVAAAINLL
jgi:hypothetical protein